MRCDLGHFLPKLPEMIVEQMPDESWLPFNWIYTCKACKQSKFVLDEWGLSSMYVSSDGNFVNFEPENWINTIAKPRCNKGHFCKVAEDTDTVDVETIRNLTEFYCAYCKEGKIVYWEEIGDDLEWILSFYIEIDNEGNVLNNYEEYWVSSYRS